MLDVAGDGNRTGKPTGADLRDGNPSLPLVLALAHDPEVKRVFEKHSPSQQEIDGALEQVRRSGVLDEATRMCPRLQQTDPEGFGRAAARRPITTVWLFLSPSLSIGLPRHILDR